MNSIKAALVIGSFAMASGLAVANADAPFDADTVTIRYDDLNLSAAAGTDALMRRIRAAASRVCGRPSPYDVQGSADYRRCLQDTTEQARAQIRWPSSAVANDQ